MRDIHVLTNCTSRKSVPVPDIARARSLPIGTIESVGRTWKTRIAGSSNLRAGDLYAGRSFHYAKRAAQQTGGRLFIASAGYGLIEESDFIKPYSITVSGAVEDNVLSRTTVGDAKGWWSVVGGAERHLQSLECSRALFVALPIHYIEMLADDLSSVVQKNQCAVVLFVAQGAMAKLPDILHPSVMPYGNALDADDSDLKGTGTDLAQRQLLHFASTIFPKFQKNWSIEDARQAVASFSEKHTARITQKNKQVTDAEIFDAIIKARKSGATSWTAALRFLRRELMIACAQSRFQKIYAAS